MTVFHFLDNLKKKLAKTLANLLQHVSGKVCVGGTERDMCGGREEERMEKSMTHRKKNYFQLYYVSRFANTCGSIT